MRTTGGREHVVIALVATASGSISAARMRSTPSICVRSARYYSSQRCSRTRYLARNELWRLCLDILRAATESLSTYDIEGGFQAYMHSCQEMRINMSADGLSGPEGLQLPRRKPGRPAHQAVLRPAAGTQQPACDTVFDLANLSRLGPRTINALAADLVMERTTLGRTILPLERDGLVAIEPGSRDRR